MSVEKGKAVEREGKEIWAALENQEKDVQALDEVISELEERLGPLAFTSDHHDLTEETPGADTEIGKRMRDVSFRMNRSRERLANLLSNVQI